MARTLLLGFPILDLGYSIPAAQDGMTELLDMSPDGHLCLLGVQASSCKYSAWAWHLVGLQLHISRSLPNLDVSL